MGAVVVGGASCMCTFGTTPATLMPTSQTTCLGCSKPVATIQDVTLPPFGMCVSLTNPAVASATAAALGVLTPQPCTCAPAGPWTPGKPSVMVGGKPVLTQEGKLVCALGMGNISITSPGQTKIVIS